jgi:F-type H+-transporting ATPase subunit a
MEEHELWFTALLNDYLAGPASALLNAVGVHAHNPERPWANFVAMQVVVLLVIVVLFAWLRRGFSVEKPGKAQHIFEWLYTSLHEQGGEIVGHGASRYLSFFGTLFIFILFCNLIGVIPGFESPTMFMPAPVPAGCALAAFGYYHLAGIQVQGWRYILHFFGPVKELPWWLLPFMVPLMFLIEIISHSARAMSLTIRLFANMFAGEMVTVIFLGLIPIAIANHLYFVIAFPAVFMGLHVFVSLLQAFIFTLLTMVYVQGAVAHEH